MNKQTPEYIRVREEIAMIIHKEEYELYPNHVEINNKWETLDKDVKKDFLHEADSILEIKELAIIDDNQDLPSEPEFYKDWGGDSGRDGYRKSQKDMLKSNFKKVVE